ncbi:MAG: DUF3006 domain-containing protein [Clostridia bacterium]|nr:DUF3006 domain-containing protein [Clostridia bacterium]
MEIIIDRIEGDFVVVETPDGNTYNLPKSLFKSCAEGDVFIIKKDADKTQQQKKETEKLMDELFK